MAKLTLEANGRTCEIEVDPLVPLVTVLRDDLGLRGTKVGCGNGECGACTVLMDGQAVCSCLVPAGRANGRRIDTIESLGNSDEMHPLQRNLVERGAFQCGFARQAL